MRISATVGYRWLADAELEPARFTSKSRRRPLDAREIAEFATYYRTSPSRTQIYRKYNIEKKTLEEWLFQLNLDPPKPDNARSSISKELAIPPEHKLYEKLSGKTTEEPRRSIADRFRSLGLATFTPDRA